jgi:hypothetical protein
LNRVTNHSGHASQAHFTSFQPWPLLPGAEVLLVSFSASAISASVIGWKWRCGRGSGSSGNAHSTGGGFSLKNQSRSAAVMFTLSLDSPSLVDRAGMFRCRRPCRQCAAFQSDSVVALCSRLFAQSFFAVRIVERKVFWAAFLVSVLAAFRTSRTACWQSLFHQRAPLGLYSLRWSKMAIEVSSMQDERRVDSASISAGSSTRAGMRALARNLFVHASFAVS